MMIPMKIAVISDIHGNLEAFTQVLKVIDSQPVDHIVSLGDNIGYGPDPEAVMVLINQYQIMSVLGNHEMILKDHRFIKWFNPKVQKNVGPSHAMLSPESVRRIKQFPRALVVENTRFVHGCPEKSPFLYLFQLTASGVKRKMSKMKEKICFIGHTHELGMMIYNPLLDQLDEKTLKEGRITLNPGNKYIINAGSVGQPRDINKDAKLIFFDAAKLTIDVHYIPYDNRTTIHKIRQAGFSESFAEKLMTN